jgi:hypothetical protein
MYSRQVYAVAQSVISRAFDIALVICTVSKDCSKIIEELKVVVKLARMRRNVEEEQ